MAKNIEVTLTLNSKDFDRKLRTAKGSLKDFSQGGNVARGTVIGLAARLAPLAAGFVAVKGSIDGLSRSLGVASRFEDVQIVLEGRGHQQGAQRRILQQDRLGSLCDGRGT